MPQPSSISWKLGSDSSPLNILGETSSTPQVLLDKVKPVWANAQGDHGELSVDRVGIPVEWVLLVRVYANTCLLVLMKLSSHR